ncbi:hypothetical protein TcCL_NonESM06118 [Trypanosoma cruzi]|nr:hypothetical protein TcCL_NonESM06118 [Trypanosoma cruzi]
MLSVSDPFVSHHTLPQTRSCQGSLWGVLSEWSDLCFRSSSSPAMKISDTEAHCFITAEDDEFVSIVELFDVFLFFFFVVVFTRLEWAIKCPMSIIHLNDVKGLYK